jgi:uncharacterized protein (TIGR02246 family)
MYNSADCKEHPMKLARCFAGLTLTMILMMSLSHAAQCGAKSAAQSAADEGARQAVIALNQKFADACRTMDNPGTAALWADDGVDLIPGMLPMVGKAAISDWLNGLTAQLAGAKMEYCTVDWREINIQDSWAFEWGITRQKIVFPPPQKTAASEGKVLLVLKRQKDSSWKIRMESWTSNPSAEK